MRLDLRLTQPPLQVFGPESRIYRLRLFPAILPSTSGKGSARFNAKSSRQGVDKKTNTCRSPFGNWADHWIVRHDASVQSRARFDLGARAGSSTPLGNGAVAFAARPGAAVWQLEHSRGNRAADTISAAPLLHASVGSNPNSAWPNDSLLAARPHRKHARHARPHWY